jgi:hypothetical protein
MRRLQREEEYQGADMSNAPIDFLGCRALARGRYKILETDE